jgi:NAD(P)-dependent dehydrogenase (short-subunit alcohol dehydrogenase family)
LSWTDLKDSAPESNPTQGLTKLVKNKVAIITGAGNQEGIGFAVAQLFVQHGAFVALVDIDEKGVNDSAKAIGTNAIPFVGDVRDLASCNMITQQVFKKWGKLNILVNGAGVVQSRKLLEITDQDYDFVMDVNTRGTLHMSQASLPFMKSGDAIICVASVSGQRGAGLMGGPHYACSKGAVLALMKSMAREYGQAGIRINAVNPGVIMTRMNANAYDESAKRALIKGIPLGRLGRPSDVAGACLYLGSELSSYVTGACLDINGGMHIH